MKNRSSSLALLLSLLGAAAAGCSHAAGTASASDPGSSAAGPSTEVYRVPVASLPSFGDADALVTIVEFTDYECPFCGRAEKTMERLRATYGSALRFVVAETPLPIHDHARPAAFAALAADAQGKFEAMHANLFALAGAISDESIEGAARASDLDPSRFEADRRTAPLAPSEQLAEQFGVHGTPTFFVGGRRVVGAQPYETFQSVIDERLAAARSLVASGVRPRDVYASLTASGADRYVEATKEAETGSCGTSCNEGAGPGAEPSDAVETVSIDGAPAKGPANAPITIVAFADFECPFCLKSEATLRAVEQAHPGDVRIVFKNDPLPIHAHARLAADAGVAAANQGHFWELHDRLFGRPAAALDRANLLKIAADMNLDAARFAADLDDPRTDERVQRDADEAKALGVNGTPTFFVNGHRVIGAQPQATFEAAIAKR